MASKKSTATGTPTAASTLDASVAVADDGSWDARDAIALRAVPGQEPGGPPAGVTRPQAVAAGGRTSQVTITRATVANGEVVAPGKTVDVSADEAAQLIQAGKASRVVAAPEDTSAALAAGLVVDTGLTATTEEAARPKSMGVAGESDYATAERIAGVAPNAVAADPVVAALQHADPAVATAPDVALRERA